MSLLPVSGELYVFTCVGNHTLFRRFYFDIYTDDSFTYVGDGFPLYRDFFLAAVNI